MSEMEEKLGAILNNPQMMQQIMSMAQAMGSPSPPVQEAPPQSAPAFDPAMLQALSGIMQKTGADPRQRSLINALSPYISHSRASKLEKAMRAAKLAEAASSFLGAGGLKMLTGR